MNRLTLFVILMLLPLLICANAVPGPQREKPLFAKNILKLQLSQQAMDRVDLPEALTASIDRLGIKELDDLISSYGKAKIFRAHIRLKDKAFENEHGVDRWILIKFENSIDVFAALDAFKAKDRWISWASPETYFYTTAIPNDTYYANNWGHNNTAQLPVYSGGSHSGAGVGTVGFDTDAPLAWDQSQGYGSSSIIIAVIDTGVDTAHPDLRLVAGYDYGDNDANPMDDSADPGHGTACSGVTAGRANNGLGVTGVAGGCSVMPVKIADSTGALTGTAIENALYHVGDNSVDVASMSYGGGYDYGDYPSSDTAYNYAYTHGVVLLAATANDNTSTISYPANHPYVISVGAASPTGQRKSDTSSDGEYWWGSNYGTNTIDARDAVDIMAPTILPATDITGAGNGYNTSSDYYMWFNGTSCATPYAAGVAALILSKEPTLTPAQVRTALTSTATDMTFDGGAGWDRFTGYGLVNANNALSSLVPGLPACTITAPAIGAFINIGETATVNVTATDSDGTITQVQFFIDDVLQYTDFAAPFTWNWDTTGYSNGSHAIKAIATDNSSNSAENSISVTLLAPADEGFESGNFNAFSWSNLSASPWTVQSDVSLSGTYAAKSGIIAHSASTSLAIPMTVSSAGSISFYQMTSSESGYDYLRFYIDGVQQGQWSGVGVWTQQSYAVTAGLHTFSWTYSKDVSYIGGSDCAYLDHIIFPPHGVYYAPPQNFTVTAGNVVVNLAWQAPASGTPTGYDIYKDSVFLTNVASLSYADHAVTNGTSYSYYLKAIYSGGDSDATETLNVTPAALVPISGTIGANATVTGTSEGCPINIYYKSLHGQSVYTRTELEAAGITGPINITQIGFYISSSPTLALPSFVIRMKHTTAANVSSWQDATGMTTVYSSASYMPTAGGYEMLTLSTPFLWNGTDNIVIDTAFNRVANWSSTGTVRYTSSANGFRFARSDDSDQTGIWTGGSVTASRPNLKLTCLPIPEGPSIVVAPLTLTYGNVAVGTTDTKQFTIQNTGDLELTGTITPPSGYSVALAGAKSASYNLRDSGSRSRVALDYSVNAGTTNTYTLTFAPSALIAYNGNVVISSTDVDNPTVDIAVTGTGCTSPTISFSTDAISADVILGEESSDAFTVYNTGDLALTYTITIEPSEPPVTWFNAFPLSGSIAGGGEQSIACFFSTAILDFEPGHYEATLSISSNDPLNPSEVIPITMDVTAPNNAPTIDLPETFEFDMNHFIVVDFSLYVDDLDSDPLELTVSGDEDLLVTIEGLEVTIASSESWIGSEELTFTVSDGTDEDFDIVTVNVSFVNTPPTIVLPDSFELDMNQSLIVDFSAYVNDIDEQSLTLDFSGNTNVFAVIDGLEVTFTASEDWYGEEELTFTVSDGIEEAFDTVMITVNQVITNLDIPVVSISRGEGLTLLEWSVVPNANGYWIYRAEAPGDEFVKINETTELAFEDYDSLDKAFYQVKAVYIPQVKGSINYSK